MAKTGKKSPTLFFWLSLLTSAVTPVMFVFNWFSFQVASFGIYNLEQQKFHLWQIEDCATVINSTKENGSLAYIDKAVDGSTLAQIAMIAMYATVGAMILHVLVSLVLVRRTPPIGFIPGGIAVATGLGFLIAHARINQYLLEHQADKLDTLIFQSSVFPFLVIILGVATIVLGLFHRQESRALYAVKHPRAFVFPPENPEIV
ncbi:MAG: hypothetical protein ACOYJY_06105 [Acutalibacteraceae bacterium]|jgi:carbon starvation protein CstA